ncbi:MAG TPA: class I SAM-dependent methyltransferase [Blastocatellia bacterium]|nr:class I SAM-dependent methyltransferase [Blastocatellia bacterium]
MNDTENIKLPPRLPQIMSETTRLNFTMASDPLTGCLLRTLAATKPAGDFLELGTGTGVAAAWLLDGMDERSRLISVEMDEAVLDVAKEFLGDDPRTGFFHADGAWWLERAECFRFDLIFADSWPGKYTHLEEALRLLKRGGLYVIDDMLPQPNWPDGHAQQVDELISILENRKDLLITRLNWSTGVIIGTKI